MCEWRTHDEGEDEEDGELDATVGGGGMGGGPGPPPGRDPHHYPIEGVSELMTPTPLRRGVEGIRDPPPPPPGPGVVGSRVPETPVGGRLHAVVLLVHRADGLVVVPGTPAARGAGH